MATGNSTRDYHDHEIPLPRLRSISSLWTVAAVLAALGVAALAVDVPIARWIDGHKLPSSVKKLFGLSETFGHAVGIGLIVLTIGVLDPWRRGAIPRILVASLGSGLFANVFKLLVSRSRPHSAELTGSGLDTFVGWLPLLGNRSLEQSFPSSHAAVAAGLAIALAAYYPRGRWLFPLFAAWACCQRLLHESHFLSDVIWGAAVGCIFAPLCIYGSRLAAGLDRLEADLQARAGRCPMQGPHRRVATQQATSASPPDDVTRAA